MYSKAHFAISATVGAVVVIAVGATPSRAVLLVGYAAILGTAIDLDHFLIARLRTGDWRHTRFAGTHPRAAFLDQDELFEPGIVGERARLLSHVLIAGGVTGGAFLVDPLLALVSGVVLYAHVVCDIVHDIRGARRR